MSEQSPKFLIFLVFGILLLMPLSASAQIKIDPKVERIHFSGKAFVTLPFSKSAKRSPTEASIQIEGFGTIEKIFELRKPIFVSPTELCSESDRISQPFVDESFIYRVRKYYSYEFAGKTFAYQVEYEFFDAETGDEVGATTAAFYFDEVGRRTFGIRCVKDFKLDRLPDWVKNLKKNSSTN